MLDGPGTALVTRTKWVRVPPPALVCCPSMTPGPDGQAVGCNPTIKQVRLLPASLAHSGVAQVVEHFAEDEEAAGSTPAAGTAVRQGCAQGERCGLQIPCRGFVSFRPCCKFF